jgi:hypothetical protein
MKRVLFSLIAICAFAFTTSVTAQAPLLAAGEIGPDTLNNAETIYHYFGGTSFATARRLKDLGSLEAVGRLDSLTGTTNATATLQYAYDLAGTIWYDAASTSLNAGSNTLGRFARTEDTELTATWARMKYESTGTQTSKVQTVWAFKKRL